MSGESTSAFIFVQTAAALRTGALNPGEDGRWRIAVNLRLAEPKDVAGIVVDHFDGLDSFKDLPRDGRCVGDMWF
jgi:hypothetical protein